MKVVEYEIKRLEHRDVEQGEKDAQYEVDLAKIKEEQKGEDMKSGIKSVIFCFALYFIGRFCTIATTTLTLTMILTSP